MNKAIALGAAMAAAAGMLLWGIQQAGSPLSRDAAPPAGVQQPGAAAPQAGASAPAPTAEAPQPTEQLGESADSATGLERILPRESVGHAAGLHKAKDALGLGSSAALVLEPSTRQVLLAKNPDAVLPMASITKLMTGLLTVEARLPMDEVITITQEDVDTERLSRSRLRVGSQLTRAEALHLALMSSENRAAHALGRTWPGGLEAFVKAMNDKARQLGMAHTTYADPTGLSNRNQSTASDLAALVVAASGQPLLREYSTTRQYVTTVGRRTLQYNNSNRLVKDPDWDIALQKTGYIIEAGHCVVMRTRLGTRDLVVVLLDANDNRARSADAERIRRWVAGPDTDSTRVARAERAARRQPAARKAAARDDDEDDDRKPARSAKAQPEGKADKREARKGDRELVAKADKADKADKTDKIVNGAKAAKPDKEDGKARTTATARADAKQGTGTKQARAEGKSSKAVADAKPASAARQARVATRKDADAGKSSRVTATFEPRKASDSKADGKS